MKIAECILELKKIQDKYGDLPVQVFDPDAFEDGHIQGVQAFIGFEGDPENPDKILAVTFMDEETALAFVDSSDDDE